MFTRSFQKARSIPTFNFLFVSSCFYSDVLIRTESFGEVVQSISSYRKVDGTFLLKLKCCSSAASQQTEPVVSEILLALTEVNCLYVFGAVVEMEKKLPPAVVNLVVIFTTSHGSDEFSSECSPAVHVLHLVCTSQLGHSLLRRGVQIISEELRRQCREESRGESDR